MNNLLTVEDRQMIKSEYRRRRFVVALSLVILLLVVAVVLAIAIYGTFAIKLSGGKDLSTAGQSAQVQDAATQQKTLTTVSKALAVFVEPTQAEPTAVLREVLAVKPGGITLTEFSYTHVSGTEYVAVIHGRAASRKTLVEFTDSLKANKLFASVESPITNVIRDTDAPFSITIGLAKKK